MDACDGLDACRMPCPSGNKDRHSKVLTAKGVRDRRIRLSPETATKFYEVHHRLGFDHPTKSVEWLLQQSHSAIDGLPELFHFHDYLHDSETGAADGLDRTNPCLDTSDFVLEWEDGNQWPFCSIDKLQGTEYLCRAEKRYYSGESASSLPKTNFYVEQSRDSGFCAVGLMNPKEKLERRATARERARERTKEKNNSKRTLKLPGSDMVETNQHNLWESAISECSESVGDNVHSHGLSFPDENSTSSQNSLVPDPLKGCNVSSCSEMQSFPQSFPEYLLGTAISHRQARNHKYRISHVSTSKSPITSLSHFLSGFPSPYSTNSDHAHDKQPSMFAIEELLDTQIQILYFKLGNF